LPDNLVALVVVQRLFGGDASGNTDRQDHIAQLLAFGPAHHPAHRLHHVNLALARVHEQDCVQRGHVHPFGQAAGIGQDARGGFPGVFLQPVEQGGALARAHRAVHMAHLAFQQGGIAHGLLAFVRCEVFTDHPGKFGAHHFGRFDVLAERQRAVHRLGIGQQFGAQPGLGQGLVTADDLGGVVQLQFVGAIGQALLHAGTHHGFVHGQHQNLVIGQQPVFDGPAKPRVNSVGP
jgi:hypothetical protein